ncbi:hypothetical protein [Citrobacter amalonaticus]|uniref:hypothetical protein n=1 Tax=Citrobacter amalonaticus TaxID=35703 RepID=UPI0028C10C4A|nr:hypothetical protein [Citrobacter amalonaticus]MDT7071154.1 hypothetical protein [Citrobacter amalonaticus]
MEKVLLNTKNAANWSTEEMSIRAEQLYYLLQTLAENYNSMEDVQKFRLIEIAWNFSGDVNAWFSAKESCEK